MEHKFHHTIPYELLIAFFSAIFLGALIALCVHTVSAESMQSSSYRILIDSVNVGGGFSTSSSYTIESTAGEVGTGDAASGSYALRAGYQQMFDVYLAMTTGGDVALSPAIGPSGGTANGSTTVTVTTDSVMGYELSIEAEDSPAMQSGGDTIADYVPVGADPDFTFTTAAADAHFGYSPEGTDIVARFRDDGSVCNAGSGDTSGACWEGLATTTELIAQGGANHPTGAETRIQFRVGIGASVVQPGGAYVATTTLTALPL